MADDGRTFFATKDSLVPRDKNGTITDVYEYVGGRPQLISGALAARDFTGESEVLGLFARPETTGLEAVSRDGTDVYFSTFDTLVDEDHNGQFVKFYDARTNGGFAQPPMSAPCAAADECHGADSSPPTPPTITSGTTSDRAATCLQEKQAKKKKAKHKKKKPTSEKQRSASAGGPEQWLIGRRARGDGDDDVWPIDSDIHARVGDRAAARPPGARLRASPRCRARLGGDQGRNRRRTRLQQVRDANRATPRPAGTPTSTSITEWDSGGIFSGGGPVPAGPAAAQGPQRRPVSSATRT